MANKRTHDEMAGATPALQRLYETGDWSDLTVEAKGGKLFKVHRAIICPASTWFHTACTSGFRPTNANTIKLHEREKIVDAILSHLYQWPAEWTQIPKAAAPVLQDSRTRGGGVGARGRGSPTASLAACIQDSVNSPSRALVSLPYRAYCLDLIELRVAADKYKITSMVASIEATFDHIVTNLNDNAELVRIGHGAYEREEAFLKKMRDVVLKRTAEKVPEIFADKTMFDLLCKNTEYMRQAVLGSSGGGGGVEGRDSEVKPQLQHVRAGQGRYP